jgi:hypothetical protein
MNNKLILESMNKRSRVNFNRTLNDKFLLTFAWVDSATSLHHAAEKLARIWLKDAKRYTKNKKVRWSWNSTLCRSFMLLSAFAIENLIKGIIMAKTQVDLQSFIDHDLRKYWKKTQLIKNDKEDFLLDQLTDCIKYAGRYPFPKREGELSGATEYPEGGLGPKLIFKGGDIGLVDEMFHRLFDECKKLMDSTGIRIKK